MAQMAQTSSETTSEEPIIDETSILVGTVLAADASEEDKRSALDRRLPEVEVFEHRDFKGNRWRTSFGYKFVGSDWNDKISSVVVYSGYVEFFADRDYGGASKMLGPGQYAFVGDVGIGSDTISSWKTYYGS